MLNSIGVTGDGSLRCLGGRPLSAGLLTAWLCLGSFANAQLEFEAEPICYATKPTDDPVRKLQNKIENGEVHLSYDDRRGYLEALLEYLRVPVSSQLLVFSKTSLQLRRISPARPRAVYFSDDVYVGWVQHGDVIEMSAVDPQQGAIFYTIDQHKSDRPQIQRDRGQCIVCHASSRTSGVPGHLVRSVYPDRSGQPFYGSGTFTIDHRSSFKKRWGGWYVTGTHGRQRHMGNATSGNRDRPEELDLDQGANVTDLNGRLNTDAYLSAHSDIVAHLILDHQSRMHNLITRANFVTRSVQHYDTMMNEAMDRPAGYRSESAKRRIEAAAEEVVKYMLFADEQPLRDPIQGTSKFATEFSALGPRDRHGRSLRDFDLCRRMMSYPCSYLIYSASFDRLPQEVQQCVYRQLFAVLSGQDTTDHFSHLTAADRAAILVILRDTKPGLPKEWQASS